ncbi:hypothetical protein Tsubulata_025681 [Turnera subulata]|uniref:RNA polymerase sigma factor n=1 Tax=Turnera subulata TaxID=218843 RepID=A0A9Q0JAT0_9ROSI|nr:hypothetical protein Tsubulata_025681 [Turnera subulata]
MSSCLVPQFKCQPDTFCIHFRTHQYHPPNHTLPLSKNRERIWFKTLCSLSTASPSTSTSTVVLDLENLRLPSIESHSVAANRPWTYTGDIGPPKEAYSGPNFAAETLITSDEAVIAAAAAEAITLARSALKVAKDAAQMVKSYHLGRKGSKSEIGSTDNASLFSLPPLTETERAEISGDSPAAETGLGEQEKESDYLEPTDEELRLLPKQLSEGVAVRSIRQTERRAKRAKSAVEKKAAGNFMHLRTKSTSRKRRASTRSVDYSDPLRHFRSTTNAYRVLYAAEEVQLSEGIQDLLKLDRIHEELRERLESKPNFAQWATAAGVDQQTLRKRLNHGSLCKDIMIKSNIRLVISISKGFQGAGLELQDLVQAGIRGLIKGAEKFDASRGFKFSTYAHWWIKQALRRALTEHSRSIRLPFHVVEASYRVREAKERFFLENGRLPDDVELAAAAGISMKRLMAVQNIPRITLSLDQKMANMDFTPAEMIADTQTETGEQALMRELMRDEIMKTLEILSSKENQVIRWRFGMDGGRIRTLHEIGELMDVSRERVRQIELSAFRKLKSKKNSKQLEQLRQFCLDYYSMASS